MDIHGHGQLEKLYQQARGFQVVTDSEKPWAGWSKEKSRLVNKLKQQTRGLCKIPIRKDKNEREQKWDDMVKEVIKLKRW